MRNRSDSRAYGYTKAATRENGHDVDDWQRAEEEITSKKIRSAA